MGCSKPQHTNKGLKKFVMLLRGLLLKLEFFFFIEFVIFTVYLTTNL